ncbi:MAG: TolC family outer membrane protein [Acidiferrobacterales bacterium]|nr:TolC family outer membrane protein [Acidiferrobacterales bacterium]
MAGFTHAIPRLALSILVSGCLWQSAAAENLWDIYQLALENDAEYRAAAANFEAAKVDLPLSQTAFRPLVNSSATLGKQRSDFTGESVSSDNNQFVLSVDLPLYDRAQRIGISQAELQVENAALQYEIAGDNLTLRVAERYFNLLAARDNKEVARLQKVAIKRQMDLATERLDVGLGTRTDLFDAKARFERAKADEIAAEIAINNALRELAEITGLVPQSIASLSENSPLELPEPNNLEHWTTLAKTDNLNVRAEEINLLVAGKEIDRQRAARRPTLNVGANQRWNDTGPTATSDGTNSTTTVGLTLDIPIYLGGAINLRTEQAARRFTAAEQVLEQLKRSASTQTTAAFLDVTSGISEVEALAEAIRAGESALEAKEEGFSAGLTTNLDVLDAQRDLSRSRTDFLRAKYNYIIALLRLENAIGNLGDEDIQYINDWLENNQSASYRYNDFDFDFARNAESNTSATTMGRTMFEMRSFTLAIQ